MTAQVPDFLLKGRKKYEVLAFTDPPFTPAGLGLAPQGLATNNWRGWVATYALRRGCLVVRRLEVTLWREVERVDFTGYVTKHRELVTPPPINGVKPVETCFGHEFRRLDLPLSFDGAILIGRGFIESLYIHMGFQAAWKFMEVHELQFRDGRLQAERDVSEVMAVLRQRMEGEDEVRFAPDGRFILHSFDRRYRL